LNQYVRGRGLQVRKVTGLHDCTMWLFAPICTLPD